ncbi:MAG: fumarate hydratase [Candidatus Omnitrophota bacterium]
MIKKITKKQIKEAVKELVIKANTQLRPDVLNALNIAKLREKKILAKNALSAIIENARIAKKEKLAICQDTGLPVVFVELGDQVTINGNITQVIMQAVVQGYKDGYLRASIQLDPLTRKQKPSYDACLVHVDIVKGEKLKLTLFPKGFGSENKAKVKMFNPTSSIDDIEEFIISAVKEAGASACPPYIIGVGIGGTQDFACLLAKKSLLEPINKTSKDENIAVLEKRLLKKINALGIGPFGLGGQATALAVNVLGFPTHIAGLPVAVNISCHALRSARIVL